MLVFAKISKSISLLSFSVLFVGLAIWQMPVAHAAVYAMPAPGNDIVGEVVTVRSGSDDTLLTIGNRYGVGMHEMLEANPQLHQDQFKASQYLGRGKKVIVPTQYILPVYRKGIVINLPELRLYYFTPDGKYVYTYPVGLGRAAWRTPLASTTVISKEKDPIWNVPPSIHAYVLEETGKDLPSRVMPGPENPLGPYAMHLGTSGYLIHGTIQPWSIGKYISSGCIRLHNEDVDQLYHMVTVGTQVHLINFANKAGWSNGQLYLASRVPLELSVPHSSLNPATVNEVLASKAHGANIDWNKVEKTLNESTGIPQVVGGGSAPTHMAQADMGPLPENSNYASDRSYLNDTTYGDDNRVVKVVEVYDEASDIKDSKEVQDIIRKTPGVVELDYYEN